MVATPIINFINLFGLGWLGTTVGYVGMARFLIWILFFALFQGILTSSASPSFISGKKRIASVLSLSLSLLVAIGIPGPVIESMLAGFGILGATAFIVLILGGYGFLIRKIPGEGEEETLGHVVAKFFITAVMISVLSAFQAATSSASGGMPAGVISSYNEILGWAILIPTIYLFYLLYRMFTFGSSEDPESSESPSAAQRRRGNKFRFVESRLLKAREYLEDAERHASDWADADKKQKSLDALNKARAEVHQAWTQLRRVRRTDREIRDMANNFAARMQVYENMIDDLIRINGRRP